MDPHRFFGHRNSGYYFPPLHPDPYFPPREIDERVYRARHDPHYYLPVPPVSNREFIDVTSRRRLPPPAYVDPNERIYRTVRRSSPPPPSPPLSSLHHHHKSSRKKSRKSKKRSRSKGPRSSDYDEDSPYEYENKSKDKETCGSKYKSLSDEHDSFSDADFGSPIPEHDSHEMILESQKRVVSQDQSAIDNHHQREEQKEHINNIPDTARFDMPELNSSSQEAHKFTYMSFKLLQDPFLKPGCSTKVKRFDGIVPNNANYSVVQVRDPRSRKMWTRVEPMNLPVPQFKVLIYTFTDRFTSLFEPLTKIIDNGIYYSYCLEG